MEQDNLTARRSVSALLQDESLAASGWKLTLTFLGIHDSPREVLAHGDNWLEALREGRRQLGEEGGIPAGASCVMAPNGEVTLLDGRQRRRYVLTPLTKEAPGEANRAPAPQAASAADVPPPAASSLLARSAPGEALPATSGRVVDLAPSSSATSVPVAAATAGAPQAPAPPHAMRPAAAAARSITPPPVAAPPPVVTPVPPAPPFMTPSPPPLAPHAPIAAPLSASVPIGRAKQTLEYSPERAQALQREYESARERSITMPESASPVEAPNLPHPNLRAVTASDRRASSLPPPAAALRAVAARSGSGEQRKARPLGSSLYGVRDDGLSLLHARDLDPTPESPLTYRERAYLLSGRADRVRVEVLLQAELACIRRELAGYPRGQFVRLGLFEQAFEGSPDKPPVATLEWKDWRGRAVFQLTSEPRNEASAPSSLPPREALLHEQAAAALPAPALATQHSASRLSQSPTPQAAVSRDTEANIVPVSAALADDYDDHEGRQSEPDVRLAAAFEAMSELYLLPTPVAGLEFTVQLLSRLVPAEAISCCLYDFNTDEFRFVALSGLGALDRKASAIPAAAGLFGAARRQVLIVPDVSQDRRFLAAVDGRSAIETKNLAYVPLRHRNQLLGMVQLINRSSPAGFASADVAVLSYVAEQLGEFLANCRALIG